mmetsp:Transcript_9734/g.13901  ORF Transcript_9734/g.13901 Transcript_9734/m.13901 type:complete len:133 (+) Transcript_9734:840-1238(+)
MLLTRKVARASSGMAPFGKDTFRVAGDDAMDDAVDDGVGEDAVGVNFVCCTVGMVTICEFSSLTCVADISGCEEDVVAIIEFESDDEGTEIGAFDDTTTFLSENCGGNGPDCTSSRGAAFSIGESENEVGTA